jgi:hypothetical protein
LLKLLDHLVEPFPDNLEVVGEFKPPPFYGNDAKGEKLEVDPISWTGGRLN